MQSGLRLNKLFLFLSLSLCVAVFAGACGGSDDEAAAAPDAPAAPAAPAAVTEPADAMPAAPVLEGASAAPIVQPTAAPAMPAVEAKIDRVIFGMSPVSEEYSNPMRQGPPNNIQLNPMYEYLIGMDPVTGAWTRELATEWSVEPDGKNIRFKLQEGVQFHDGWGEMTAKDVKLTFEELAHPEAGHGNSGYMRSALNSVEIINDHELVLDVKAPDAGLLWVISRQEQSILVISKDAYDDLGHSPTLQDEPLPGTGPYEFMERREGEYIRFERISEPHWRFTPDFPELELRWLSEASTRLASLLTDEIHITNLPEDQIQQAVSDGMAIAKGNAAGQRAFFSFLGVFRTPSTVETRGSLPPLDAAFRYPDSPFHDIRVRQALSHAVDRDEINTAFFNGKAELMHINHFHPTRPGWDPSWEQRYPEKYGYNPQRAIELLAEAGYGPNNPYEINMHLQEIRVTGGPDVIEGVAGQFRDIGVKTNLISMDAAAFSAQRRGFELSNDLRFAGTSSHLLMGFRVYSSGHAPRGSGMELPDVDELYSEVRITVDPVRQNTLLMELGELQFQNHMDIPMLWLPPEAVYNPNFVSGYNFPGSVTGLWTHLELIGAAQ